MTDSELIDHLAGLVEQMPIGKFRIRLSGLAEDDAAAAAAVIDACNYKNLKRLLELARKGAEQ